MDLPEDVIVECESLRYAHLIGMDQVERSRSAVHLLRILVLGEVRSSAMRKMLAMLTEALDNLEFAVDLAVKPHPNSPRQPRGLSGTWIPCRGGTTQRSGGRV